MNATQSQAGSLREHLISFNPELWYLVVRNDLQGAACWAWPQEKMQLLSFRAYNHRPVVDSCEYNGMFDLSERNQPVSRSGTPAWAGLPPEMLEPKYGVILKERNEVDLALGLNRAMADWLGRTYEPRTSHERERYGTILVKRAAETGDVEEMHKIFSIYSYDTDDARYLPALRTAAYRKHKDFVIDLWQRIGFNLLEAAYAKCELDKVAPEDKADILMFVEVGLPVPKQHVVKAAIWMAEALAPRNPKGKEGVPAQPVCTKS